MSMMKLKRKQTVPQSKNNTPNTLDSFYANLDNGLKTKPGYVGESTVVGNEGPSASQLKKQGSQIMSNNIEKFLNDDSP